MKEQPTTMNNNIIRIEAPAVDDWTCRCGNSPDTDGFQQCNVEGVDVQLTTDVWTGLYCCQRCTLILDSNTYDPICRTVSAVAPEVVITPAPHNHTTWSPTDWARMHNIREARKLLEVEVTQPLCGDVVEFADGVLARLAEDDHGWFGVPEDHHERFITPSPRTATGFELSDDGTVHYYATRTTADTVIDSAELTFVGSRHRATTVHTTSTQQLRFQISARVWAAPRVAPTATLARIRSLIDHAQQRPFCPASPGQDPDYVQYQALRLVSGLDRHLTHRGPLPAPWSTETITDR
ncbi:hypothetical protein ACTD5D_20580 [Nocardia takedensis]|uniref:hypothetical protein n=1 Tax=Nocardia takedensis TaxID=259390 RepID=UPI003F762606